MLESKCRCCCLYISFVNCRDGRTSGWLYTVYSWQHIHAYPSWLLLFASVGRGCIYQLLSYAFMLEVEENLLVGEFFPILLQKCEKTLPLHILLVCRAGREEDLESHTQSWESAPVLLSGSILKDPRKVLMLVESVWFFSKGDLGYWGPLPSSHSLQKQASPRRPWIGGQLKWWWWEHVVESNKWWQTACPHFSC